MAIDGYTWLWVVIGAWLWVVISGYIMWLYMVIGGIRGYMWLYLVIGGYKWLYRWLSLYRP